MSLKQISTERAGVLKCVVATTMVFSIAAGLGLYLLKEKHEEELDELEKDTARFCLDWAAEHYERTIRRREKEARKTNSRDVEGTDALQTEVYAMIPCEGSVENRE